MVGDVEGILGCFAPQNPSHINCNCEMFRRIRKIFCCAGIQSSFRCPDPLICTEDWKKCNSSTLILEKQFNFGAVFVKFPTNDFIWGGMKNWDPKFKVSRPLNSYEFSFYLRLANRQKWHQRVIIFAHNKLLKGHAKNSKSRKFGKRKADPYFRCW